jgi:hypothetical protein
MQRRVLPADAVELGDLGNDVAGRGEVPRTRISYFSESRYSSLPGTGADSHSSNPEYMPHRPEPMVASAARIRKPGRPIRAETPG